MLNHLRPAITLVLTLTALLGLAYPLAVTGVAQALMPAAANGSLIEKDGAVIGSILIGQSFGADMLHAALAEFSESARRPIEAVVLVVPGHDIVFRASPVELAGLETPDALAWPTASRLSWVPVTCIRV